MYNKPCKTALVLTTTTAAVNTDLGVVLLVAPPANTQYRIIAIGIQNFTQYPNAFLWLNNIGSGYRVGFNGPGYYVFPEPGLLLPVGAILDCNIRSSVASTQVSMDIYYFLDSLV